MYVRVRHTWFCPIFPGARHVPSTTSVGLFFTCPRTARSRVRVRVRVRACASYVVLPSFPWRASRFLHDGRRPFFHVSTYSPFTGPCKGPCTCVCLVHGFAQFSMARVTFLPRRASAVFFHVSTYSPFTGPCKGQCTCVCLVHGLAQFSMARVTFRPRRASAVFFHVSTYSPFTGPCTWFCLVFHGARPVPSTTLARVSDNTFFVMTSHA